jgi:hypothetical protein
MAKLSDLTAGIAARLSAGFNAGTLWTPNQASLASISVLVQDANDIQNKIDEALGKVGTLCLVNMPSFRNNDPQAGQVNGIIKVLLEVGEDPTLWRDDPLTVPTGLDLAEICSRLLQQYFIAGFQPLRVLDGDFKADKKRQVYTVQIETLRVFDSISV